MTVTDGASVRAEIHRRTHGASLAKLLLEAVERATDVRFTKSGILLTGPEGRTAATHWTCSDVRAVKNFTAELRRAGLLSSPPSQKGPKSPRRTKPRTKAKPFRAIAPQTPWEPSRPEKVTVTITPKNPEAPTLEPETTVPRQSRRGQKGVAVERVPQWYAMLHPHLPDSLRGANRALLKMAVDLADGDIHRIVVEDGGELTVRNKAVW